jgi:putative hemolysin
MEITLLLFLILLNGLFAMSEIALVTARKTRLQKLAEAGDEAAARALRLGDDPTRFMSTVQIGITSIGVLNGIVGEATLAVPISHWLQGLGVAAAAGHLIATALVVVVLTYFSIVLGELVPKRLGQMHPETIARMVSLPMAALSRLVSPFVQLLSGSTHLVLRLLGARQAADSGVTQEEIHAVLAEGTESGLIEHQEHQMLRNVFRLDDRNIASVMVPRADIISLSIHDPLDVILDKVSHTSYSRFPVCEGGLGDIIGVVTAKQVLLHALHRETFQLSTFMEKPIFVPESLTALELLETFRTTNTRLTLVINEYGDVQGLVTVHDLLEAITGEFSPDTSEESWAIARPDGSWLLDGMIPVVELKDKLGIRLLPEEDRGLYNTLSGLLMMLLGRMPHTTDLIELAGWRFEIIDMDGNRIDKVLAVHLPADGAHAHD